MYNCSQGVITGILNTQMQINRVMIFLAVNLDSEEMTNGCERIDEKSKNCTFNDELSFLVCCLHLVMVIFVGKRYRPLS